MVCQRPLGRHLRRQQPVVFTLDYRITFAHPLLQTLTIAYRYATTRVAQQADFLQLHRAFCHACASHAQHVRHQVLRHHYMRAHIKVVDWPALKTQLRVLRRGQAGIRPAASRDIGPVAALAVTGAYCGDRAARI